MYALATLETRGAILALVGARFVRSAVLQPNQNIPVANVCFRAFDMISTNVGNGPTPRRRPKIIRSQRSLKLTVHLLDQLPDSGQCYPSCYGQAAIGPL